MLIKIGDFECTEVWDGVFYKKLSNYPQISEWKIRTIKVVVPLIPMWKLTIFGEGK